MATFVVHCLPELKENGQQPKRQLRNNAIGKKPGCFGSKRQHGLRDRIKQFSIWYNEREEYKAKDYSQRRSKRKKRRSMITKETFVQRLRWLYMFTALVWIAGLVMTFCSTVKSIGKDTTFFEKREFYRILGPITISVGVFLLLLTEGLKMNFKLNEGHVQTKFYIIDNSHKKRHKSEFSMEISVHSNNVDKKRSAIKTNKRKLYQIADEKCSSIEDLDIETPKKSKSDKIKFDFNEALLNDFGARNMLKGRCRNCYWRDQWSPVSNESDDSVVRDNNTDAADEVSERRSPKRKSHNWRRFHWTKLSQESSGSDFVVINENEAMESSGDSFTFRRRLQEVPPLTPLGTFENPLARQLSVTSRASTTSKYSNFSDDAPLIKR